MEKNFRYKFFSTTNIIEASKNYLANKDSSIVCISSICGIESIPNAPITYSVAKSALNSYVTAIAKPLAKDKIRINAIAPGNIMFSGSIWDHKYKINPKNVKEMLKDKVPLEKFGEPNDISNLALYLISPLSKFCTGSILKLMVGKPIDFKMFNKEFDLTKDTALITGAGGLLGYYHAASLIECGASIILTDISEKSLDETEAKLRKEYINCKIASYKMDVTNPDSIKSISELIISNKQQVDILINNAALDPKVKINLNDSNPTKFENLSKTQWNKELEVGLTGAFLCSQIFGAKMAQNKKGVILNIASDLSVIAPDQRIYKKKEELENNQFFKPVTYSAIKTGLIGLTKYIATYWSKDGIRCNAISPGGVFNHQDAEFVENVTKLIPLGRMANKDEYKSAVKFMCSDASSYMTGFNMVIDGGRHIW